MELNHRRDELIRFSLKDWEEESVWALVSPLTAAEQEIVSEEMGKQRSKKKKKNETENWGNKKKKSNWLNLTMKMKYSFVVQLFFFAVSLLVAKY